MSETFQCPDCQVRWARPGLTARQREIMDYLEDYEEQHRMSPTVEEIAARFGFRSLATVAEHLDNLEHKRYIARRYNRARGIRLIEPTP